jgi:hypothetical protein
MGLSFTKFRMAFGKTHTSGVAQCIALARAYYFRVYFLTCTTTILTVNFLLEFYIDNHSFNNQILTLINCCFNSQILTS